MSKELVESLSAGIVFYYKTSKINFIGTEQIMKEAASKIEKLEREKEELKAKIEGLQSCGPVARPKRGSIDLDEVDKHLKICGLSEDYRDGYSDGIVFAEIEHGIGVSDERK